MTRKTATTISTDGEGTYWVTYSKPGQQPKRSKPLTQPKKAKPMPGHKLTHYSYGVQTNCECGWHSATWYGPGARRSALAEWRGHKEAPRPATLTTTKA